MCAHIMSIYIEYRVNNIFIINELYIIIEYLVQLHLYEYNVESISD